MCYPSSIILCYCLLQSNDAEKSIKQDNLLRSEIEELHRKVWPYNYCPTYIISKNSACIEGFY